MSSFDYFRKIYHILLVILAFLNFSWNTSRLKCCLIMIQSALERRVSGVSQECLSDVPGQFLALLGCFGVRRSIKTIEIWTPIGVLSEDGFDKIDENDVFLP